MHICLQGKFWEYGTSGPYFHNTSKSNISPSVKLSLYTIEQAKKVVIEMIGHETHPDESDFGRIHAQGIQLIR